MNRQFEQWLLTLEPVEAFAKKYFNSDIEACKKQTFSYDCLCAVGVNHELFVDKYKYEQLLAEDKAAEIANTPIHKLNLVHGDDVAKSLQEKARDSRAAWYTKVARIRELERDALLEPNLKEKKRLNNAIVEVKVELGLLEKEIKANDQKLDDFMSEYGSKPENQRMKTSPAETTEKDDTPKNETETATGTKKGAVQKKKAATTSLTKKPTTRTKKK